MKGSEDPRTIDEAVGDVLSTIGDHQVDDGGGQPELTPEEEAHWDEVDRLWRAVKRDFFASVEFCAGFRPGEPIEGSRGRRFRRFERLKANWVALRSLDPDVTWRLRHGIEQVFLSGLHKDTHKGGQP